MPHLWLGSALASHVDRRALEAVADVDGDTIWRVTIREDHTLDDLESVLASVLPSFDDWQAAVGGRSGGQTP